MQSDLELKVECFNLKYTLECGQCFRWKYINEYEYVGVIADRVIRIKQQNNKLFVLSAATNSIDVVNPQTKVLEKTIPLKIAGFSTKFNPIKNSDMFIITNVMENKYVVFDLLKQKVLQINPIDIPITTLTVVEETEFETNKNKKQAETL